jgi:SAM-dependent methyltransferase
VSSSATIRSRAHSGWRRFWDEKGPPGPWLRGEAAHFTRELTAAFALEGTDVLDFGCGYGFVAEMLAPKVRTLYVWDASPTMLDYTRARIAAHANAHVLDLDTEASPDVHLHLVIVNSVVQYLTEDEAVHWLGVLARLLRPDGRLLLSDVVGPHRALVTELRRALSRRRVRALRIAGMWRYLRSRRSAPLLRLDRSGLERIAGRNGLRVELLPRSLTHFENRLAAVLRR